jgi:hypothetical protein
MNSQEAYEELLELEPKMIDSLNKNADNVKSKHEFMVAVTSTLLVFAVSGYDNPFGDKLIVDAAKHAWALKEQRS